MMTVAANMDNTLGILFDSVVISAVLYGAGIMQAWYYYRKYKGRDALSMKVLVALVMFFDTAQMGTLTACVYMYCVTHQGDPTIMEHLFSTLIIEVIFSNVIAILVQLFYIQRIYKLCMKHWYQVPVTAFTASLSLASFVTLMVYSAQGVKYSTFAELTKLKPISVACNILAAVTDIAISLCLVVLLHTSRSEVKRTNDMINRLMLFAFNTGLPTSVSALMACISVSWRKINVWPETFIYMFFFLLLGRFYTNSLLATLNSRDYIRKAGQNSSESFSLSFRNNPQSTGTVHRMQANYPEDPIAIRIDTVNHTDTEYDLEDGRKNKG
ncbi:hypothetical protein BV25DRAFT_1920217 [Artomyces pyxidatus]|uniref:Uncharacterized protein n=1 Tax=Artomyces pyxidatus TaxID=48021 RepID=A0ACB8SLC1_9AGAM|nr:hypothetical protein BV25DRAFT_1920217 [Artomyces pyxidatus]